MLCCQTNTYADVHYLRNLRKFPLGDAVDVSEDYGAGCVSAKISIPILHNKVPPSQ